MQNKSSCTTRHSSIFDFWKDKCIDINGNIYMETERNIPNTIPVVYDWFEPECWACGRMIHVEDEEPDYVKWLEFEDTTKLYNSKFMKHSYERCHIIPRIISEDDSPSNLFLLCKDCHKKAPDVSNPHMFLKWVYKQRIEKTSIFKDFFDAREILKEDYGISYPYFCENEYILGREFNSHGGGMSEETRKYWIIQNVLKHRVDLGGYEELYREFINTMIEKIKEKKDMSAEDKVRIDSYNECLTFYNSLKDMQNGRECKLTVNA